MAGDVRGGDLRSGSTVCLHRREEPTRGGAGFRTEPGYDCQDVPLFGAARLCAIQGSGAAKARTARTGNRRDFAVARQDGTAEERHSRRSSPPSNCSSSTNSVMCRPRRPARSFCLKYSASVTNVARPSSRRICHSRNGRSVFGNQRLTGALLASRWPQERRYPLRCGFPCPSAQEPVKCVSRDPRAVPCGTRRVLLGPARCRHRALHPSGEAQDPKRDLQEAGIIERYRKIRILHAGARATCAFQRHPGRLRIYREGKDFWRSTPRAAAPSAATKTRSTATCWLSTRPLWSTS